jgi:predicted branched-subunit amino acid permease
MRSTQIAPDVSSPAPAAAVSAPDTGADLSRLQPPLVWSGFLRMLPLSLFVMVFGAAFGLAATQAGLTAGHAVFMSAAVFAGAAQFAVLELWGAQVPVLPLALTVFAINARHLLMGATLFPWLQHMTASRRYGVMVLASDSNWALSLQAFGRGQPGFGVLVGGGMALWLFWVLGTWLGTAFGGAIQDPRRWGLDMVMACFLLAMVVGGEKNVRMTTIWVVAAGVSLLAFRYLPENSHVVAGALAGGALGACWPESKHEP